MKSFSTALIMNMKMRYYCQPITVANSGTIQVWQKCKEIDVFSDFRVIVKISTISKSFCGTMLQTLPKLKTLISSNVNFHWLQLNSHQ